MKRRLDVASLAHLLLLSLVGDACTADAYDGEWNGSATVTNGRCRTAMVTLSVLGKVVTGQARFGLESQSIHGTVSEDGTFGATIGFRPLSGKFIQDMFEGSFSISDCTWKLVLKRGK
jgi:hypothetical protein